jgi:hypothetical protein
VLTIAHVSIACSIILAPDWHFCPISAVIVRSHGEIQSETSSYAQPGKDLDTHVGGDALMLLTFARVVQAARRSLSGRMPTRAPRILVCSLQHLPARDVRGRYADDLVELSASFSPTTMIHPLIRRGGQQYGRRYGTRVHRHVPQQTPARLSVAAEVIWF